VVVVVVLVDVVLVDDVVVVDTDGFPGGNVIPQVRNAARHAITWATGLRDTRGRTDRAWLARHCRCSAVSQRT